MTEKLTQDSTLKEVYASPVGHDVLQKILLQYGVASGFLEKGPAGSLKLKTVMHLTKRMLDETFWATFLHLVNAEQDMPNDDDVEIARKWWKEAVFYQVYPRSFADSNADGIGDLPGIIDRLDYLKTLGIDAVWLSPIYDSPNDDNGYDIRDYYKIMQEFGTMEDFKALLNGLHERGMKLIMDLVVNHTSDEHAWFKEALQNPDSPCHDYYIFRKGDGKNPPNNWTSFFSGSAWNYYEENDEYAMHLFSKKQMDLNWENPEVRERVKEMIRWWLDMGVDGFRLDVINYISKEKDLPQGNPQIGELMGYYGIEHYFYGPKLHEYLREIKREAFEPYDAFTVGETPGVGMQMSKLLTGDYRGELDMVFSFDHLETPGHVRFDDYQYDLNYLKDYYTNYMREYGNHYWLSLFYDNHDNPRMLSKVNPNPVYHDRLAKLLAMIQLTMKGTPFIYQGQEIGMANQPFTDISELRDVESINLYNELLESMSEEDAFKKVLAGTRDHARSMIDWEQVDRQKYERDSVYYFYKKLICLRKKYPALVYGNVNVTNQKKKNLFTYYRKLEDEEFYIECNLSDRPIARPKRPDGYVGVLCNYQKVGTKMQAYEACIYKKKIK